MSTLRQLRIQLKDEVLSSANRSLWTEFCRRHPIFHKRRSTNQRFDFRDHPAFRRYATVQDLLNMMEDESVQGLRHKDLVTRILIMEHSKQSSTFWSSILFVLYYPMLSRIRYRVFGHTFDPNELDQLVISAFFRSVDSLSKRARRHKTFLYLRRMTQSHVFKTVCSEQDWQRQKQHIENLNRMLERFDTDENEKTEGIVAGYESEQMVRLIFDHADGVESKENLDLVVATIFRGVNLREFIKGVPDYSEKNAERIYQRFKRRRSRCLRRLRGVFGELVGSEVGEDFYS